MSFIPRSNVHLMTFYHKHNADFVSIFLVKFKIPRGLHQFEKIFFSKDIFVVFVYFFEKQEFFFFFCLFGWLVNIGGNL